MKFRFPIVIIDEDYRSENTSGLGIRALAQAIEAEGFRGAGGHQLWRPVQFAQQQSRASAFILSIDDEEFTPGPDLDPIVLNLRNFIEEVRRKNLTCRSMCTARPRPAPPAQRHPARAAWLHPHVRGHARVRGAHIIREAKSYLEGVQPPFFKALLDYAEDGSYSWHCPGTRAAWRS
jgi:arginine decarboxylase